MKLLCLVLFLCIQTGFSLTVVTVHENGDYKRVSAKDYEREFYNEFKTFAETREISEKLQELVDLAINQSIKVEITDIPNTQFPQVCLQCRAVSYSGLKFNETSGGADFILKLSNSLLDVFKSTGGKKTSVFAMVELAKPTISYILANTDHLDSNTICSILYQSLNCEESEVTFTPIFDIPSPPVASKIDISSKNGSKLTVVHLTDVHFDPHYVPGSSNECSEGICCRGKQESDPKKRAGYWGDYNPCDSPWHTVEDIVQQVKIQYDHIDMIYFTGDIVDHFEWNYTRASNSHSIRHFYNYLRQEFPNIPIYSSLGNHEAFPANSYAPGFIKNTDVNIQWLYDVTASEWKTWLPEEALSSVRDGGYYSVLVRPGLRLIALNNNFCYGTNLWLFYSKTYFSEHLIWLYDSLDKAAKAGEKVHIISHIPTNERNCFKGWAHEYRKIIEQFSDTISAIFNGHTHQDEFNVHYSMQDTSKAYAVAWNGGSGTTFAYFNSNFRVYSVDAENYHVLDYDNWVYNLTEANLTPNQPPRWFKNYSFKKAYDLEDLSPASLDGLVNRLATNKTLLRTYWERRMKHSDYKLNEGCNTECITDTLCDIVYMEHGDNRKCEELLKIMP